MGDGFAALLQRASHGDEHAWSDLFALYGPSLLGFLRGAGAPEPDDQLSEVFLQIARDIHTFHGDEAHFRAWIFTIARNRMLDALRSRRRRPVTPVDWDAWTDATLPQVDAAVTGETDVIDAQLDLYRLLTRLEPLERDIIVLRYVADLDTKAVGAIVGRRPNTVAVVTRRALAKLREFSRADSAD